MASLHYYNIPSNIIELTLEVEDVVVLQFHLQVPLQFALGAGVGHLHSLSLLEYRLWDARRAHLQREHT